MGKPEQEPKLSPGIAFHLQPDGSWSPENLPHKVLVEAKFSGYLTIDGYRCSVFETPDGSEWAQKSVNTPATASSKEHPEPDMSKKCPECGGKATDVRGYSACCENGHFFPVKPKAASAFGKASRSMDSVASRVAAAWLAGQHKCSSCRDFAFHGPEQAAVENEGGMHHPSCPTLVAARADDLVSQVNDILHGGGWSQEDQEYDADIVAWCEKVQEKVPEMQEIFDTAFHSVMDFKGKMPASDNPRVRQIADEKMAQMLNQAAARLEIISHGLMQEVKALCEGLAKGAGISPEAPTDAPALPPAGPPMEPKVEGEAEGEAQEPEEDHGETQQAQQAASPQDIVRELLQIADAIDRSKSPDRALVAHDIQQLLASLA